MIDPAAVPIAHHPPRQPIDLRPTVQVTSADFGETIHDAIAWAAKVAQGERMWVAVVDVARSPSGRMPIAGSAEHRGALDDDVGGCGAEKELGEPVATGIDLNGHVLDGLWDTSPSELSLMATGFGMVWLRADETVEYLIPVDVYAAPEN